MQDLEREPPSSDCKQPTVSLGTVRRALERSRTHCWLGRGGLRCWPLGLLLAGALAAAPVAAGSVADEETRRALIGAVEAAAALDLYHARCRSDLSGRRTDNLNKLLVSKLRLTVLSVQDDLFPERSYRRVQQRLEQDFLAALRAAGGCPGAKRSGLSDQLRADYDAGVEAIRALP